MTQATDSTRPRFRLTRLFTAYCGEGLDERQRQLLHEQAARCLSHLFGFTLLFMPAYVVCDLLGWQALKALPLGAVALGLFYYIAWFMSRTPVSEALFEPDDWTAEKLPRHLAAARKSSLITALLMPAFGVLALYIAHDGFVPLTFLLILAAIAAWALYSGLYHDEKKIIAANMKRAEAFRRQADAEEQN